MVCRGSSSTATASAAVAPSGMIARGSARALVLRRALCQSSRQPFSAKIPARHDDAAAAADGRNEHEAGEQ